MAPVEATSRRIRAAALSHMPDQHHGASGSQGSQIRLERQVERTMRILGLTAIGIGALSLWFLLH